MASRSYVVGLLRILHASRASGGVVSLDTLVEELVGDGQYLMPSGWASTTRARSAISATLQELQEIDVVNAIDGENWILTVTGEQALADGSGRKTRDGVGGGGGGGIGGDLPGSSDNGAGGGLGEVLANPVLFCYPKEEFDNALAAALVKFE